MTQALNDTARGINNAIYQRRRRAPSVVVTAAWHAEFIDKGLDRRQSFAEYRRQRMREWYQRQPTKK